MSRNKGVRAVLLLMSLAGMSIGAAAGVGFFTFVYAHGASYLTDDPAACVNCHVMRDQHNGWAKSSHHAVAVCNDCHAPHALVPKYYVKGVNGFRHSLAFTTGWYPDNIQITDMNRRVTEAACRTCHGEITATIDRPFPHGEGLSCIRCHEEVGHSY